MRLPICLHEEQNIFLNAFSPHGIKTGFILLMLLSIKRNCGALSCLVITHTHFLLYSSKRATIQCLITQNHGIICYFMTYISHAVSFGLYTLVSELPIAATLFSTNRLCVRAVHSAVTRVVGSRVRFPNKRKEIQGTQLQRSCWSFLRSSSSYLVTR